MKKVLFSNIFVIIVLFCTIFLPISISHASIVSGPLSKTTLTNGLIGYWTMDGKDINWATNKISDKSVSGNTGQMLNLSTTTSGVSGKVGQALRFTNATQSIYTEQDLPNTDASFCLWVFVEDSASSNLLTLISNGNTVFYVYPKVDSPTTFRLYQQNRQSGTPAGTGAVGNLNVWSYVCSTRTSAGATTFYVNGTQVGTPNQATNVPLNGAVNISIGGDLSSSLNVPGKLDDVRIYNRILSANEVRQLYALGAGTKFAVSPKYSLSSGLVGWWTFDGKDTNWNTNVVRDMSGNNNNGLMINMSTSTSGVQGKMGQALKFDGSTTRIDLPSDIIGTNSVTVCAWIKPKNTAFIESIVENSRFLFMNYNYGGNLALSSDGGSNAILSTDPIQKDVWQHVCGVRPAGGANSSLYINGTQNGSSGNTGTPTSIEALGIGSLGVAPGADLYNGQIDDVRIYNRLLSANEIRQLYALGAGTKFAVSPKYSLSSGLVGWWTFDGKDTNWNTNVVRDATGLGNNGQIQNMSTTTSVVQGKMGQALKFDGVDDHVDIGTDTSLLNLTGPLSISVWVNPSMDDPSGQFEGLVNRGGSRSAANIQQYSLYRGIYGNERAASFIVSNGTTNYYVSSSVGSLNNNTWTHIVGTFDGQNLCLYLNGVLNNNGAQTCVNDPSIGTLNSASYTPAIGANSAYLAGNLFRGNMDDVKVYSRALSATEVRQIYNIGR